MTGVQTCALPISVEGSLPELKTFEDRARQAAPARLNWPAPKEAVDAIDDAEYDLVSIANAKNRPGGVHYLVDANPHVARSLRARWSRWNRTWRPADGLVTADTGALEALVRLLPATAHRLPRDGAPADRMAEEVPVSALVTGDRVLKIGRAHV